MPVCDLGPTLWRAKIYLHSDPRPLHTFFAFPETSQRLPPNSRCSSQCIGPSASTTASYAATYLGSRLCWPSWVSSLSQPGQGYGEGYGEGEGAGEGEGEGEGAGEGEGGHRGQLAPRHLGARGDAQFVVQPLAPAEMQGRCRGDVGEM